MIERVIKVTVQSNISEEVWEQVVAALDQIIDDEVSSWCPECKVIVETVPHRCEQCNEEMPPREGSYCDDCVLERAVVQMRQTRQIRGW